MVISNDFFGFLFSKNSSATEEFKNNVLKIQNSLCFLVVSFIIFTSNPFEKSFPYPIEGGDLNPFYKIQD